MRGRREGKKEGRKEGRKGGRGKKREREVGKERLSSIICHLLVIQFHCTFLNGIYINFMPVISRAPWRFCIEFFSLIRLLLCRWYPVKWFQN